MALRAVPDHPKFASLKAALKLPKGAALGWLEAMWHFTGRFTPCGDIGKYTDTQIEAWVEWSGTPGELVDAFVTSGWIDKSEEFRLVVHDWHLHADNATKLAVKRSGKRFCGHTVETSSTPTRLPVPEPVPVPVPEPEPSAPITFDGHMVAQAFLQSTGLSGSELARNVSEAARAAIAEGRNGLDVLAEMESAWKGWCAAKSAGKLAVTFGAEKFFGNGMWKDEAGWPWRNDGSAQQNQTGRVSPATERKAHADQTTKNILARRYGIDVDGAHAASGGAVSGAGDRGSDQGNVPGGVGGDGGQVRPPNSAGRVIEGDRREQILPRAG